jgi:hypothetical protein
MVEMILEYSKFHKRQPHKYRARYCLGVVEFERSPTVLFKKSTLKSTAASAEQCRAHPRARLSGTITRRQNNYAANVNCDTGYGTINSISPKYQKYYHVSLLNYLV